LENVELDEAVEDMEAGGERGNGVDIIFVVAICAAAAVL
jgi:hypothetical protein